MTGHGVALAIISPERLLAQCECGWHVSFAQVVTWELVSSTVSAHHEAVRNGSIGTPEAGR